MTAPMTTIPTEREERACDEIAKYWARYHGGLDEWKRALPELLALFGCDDEYRAGRIDLCGVTDTWEEDHGLTGADFARLEGKICGWIAAYMPLFCRRNPGAATQADGSPQAPALRH